MREQHAVCVAFLFARRPSRCQRVSRRADTFTGTLAQKDECWTAGCDARSAQRGHICRRASVLCARHNSGRARANASKSRRTWPASPPDTLIVVHNLISAPPRTLVPLPFLRSVTPPHPFLQFSAPRRHAAHDGRHQRPHRALHDSMSRSAARRGRARPPRGGCARTTSEQRGRRQRQAVSRAGRDD